MGEAVPIMWSEFESNKADGACYTGTYLESLVVQIKGVVWLGNDNLHWTRGIRRRYIRIRGERHAGCRTTHRVCRAVNAG